MTAPTCWRAVYSDAPPIQSRKMSLKRRGARLRQAARPRLLKKGVASPILERQARARRPAKRKILMRLLARFLGFVFATGAIVFLIAAVAGSGLIYYYS